MVAPAERNPVERGPTQHPTWRQVELPGARGVGHIPYKKRSREVSRLKSSVFWDPRRERGGAQHCRARGPDLSEQSACGAGRGGPFPAEAGSGSGVRRVVFHQSQAKLRRSGGDAPWSRWGWAILVWDLGPPPPTDCLASFGLPPWRV